MKVFRWCNDLAIRLPDSIVDALGLREGDYIEMRVVVDRAFEVRQSSGPEALVTRLRRFRGRLPKDFVLGRNELHSRD